MATDINVWSNVAVDVQTALASPVTITAITKANPGVVTATTHGYSDGDIVLLKIEGMHQLNFCVCRVDNKTTDTFELEGVNTTSYATFSSGTAEKITFGATCSSFQDVNAAGGEAEDIQVRTIHTDQDFVLPGNRSPRTMSFGSLWKPGDAALLALAGFDNSKSEAAVRLTFASGAKIYFACYPSVSLAPTGSAGQPVSTPVSFKVRGRYCTYTS